MFYQIKAANGDVIGRLELAHDLVIEPEQPAAAAAPPPPPKMREEKVMMPAAGDFSYEQYKENGWSDTALVSQGYMQINMVPEDGQVEPEATGPHPASMPALDGAWDPTEPAVAPPPPQDTAPMAPPPPQDTAPVAPPPPQENEPVAPPPPQDSPAQGGELPEGCSWRDTPAPKIPGREFMIKGVSYEQLQDGQGTLFDSRIHGETADGRPAVKKDGTFKKKRGLDQNTYGRILAEQSSYLAPGAQPVGDPNTPPVAPPPPRDEGPAAPPPPPPGTDAPATAPPPPANIKEMEKSLGEWGDQI